MLAVFPVIVPIFLLIFLGQGLRRLSLFPVDFWRNLDLLAFYVLYPALLFVTILRADFSALSLGVVVIALGIGGLAISVGMLASWPLMRDRLGLSGPSFSSVFQTTLRWNGFLAFAVAEKLFPPEGTAMVALMMAIIIIPVNVVTVSAVAWFTEKSPNLAGTARRIALNPLVLSATAALVMRSMPFALPAPFMQFLDMVARAALGMGLMAIGAGLRPQDALKPQFAVLVASFAKLAIYPALVVGTALLLGASGPQLSYLALCAAVPTAMNGYVLARQMGGDAELYAAIATVQTALSFITIPLVLAIVGQFSPG